jgi:FMN phosphatase YigB (HAD superfamily)
LIFPPYTKPLLFFPVPIEAAIFDIGNVLLKFNYFVAAERLRLVNGLESLPDHAPIVEAKAALEVGQIDRAEFLARAMPAFEHAGDEESFLAIWRDIFHLNTPMADFARDLSTRMPVYLLSNISCIHKEYIFEHYPVFSLFTDGAYSYLLGCLKPEPMIYGKALAQFGLRPEQVVLFDDLADNVAAARAQGWQAIQYEFRRHADFLQQACALGLTSPASNQ